jgi:hypothetical protein
MHNRIRSICKPCGGGSLCTHNLRSICKPCGGGSFCTHNVLRNKCKQCFPLRTEAQRQEESRREAAAQNAARAMLENYKPPAGVQVQPAGPSAGILGSTLGQ